MFSVSAVTNLFHVAVMVAIAQVAQGDCILMDGSGEWPVQRIHGVIFFRQKKIRVAADLEGENVGAILGASACRCRDG